MGAHRRWCWAVIASLACWPTFASADAGAKPGFVVLEVIPKSEKQGSTLLVRDLASGAERVIQRGIGHDDFGALAVSPDGRRLFYTFQRELHFRRGLYVVSLDSSEEEVTLGMARTDPSHASWSPDGKLLALGDAGTGRTIILDVDRRTQWTWWPCDGSHSSSHGLFRWSQDGRALLDLGQPRRSGSDWLKRSGALPIRRCGFDGSTQVIGVAPSDQGVLAQDEQHWLAIEYPGGNESRLDLYTLGNPSVRSVFSTYHEALNFVLLSPDMLWAGIAFRSPDLKRGWLSTLNVSTRKLDRVAEVYAVGGVWGEARPTPAVDARAIVVKALGEGEPFDFTTSVDALRTQLQ